jgi:hypothetical protein
VNVDRSQLRTVLATWLAVTGAAAAWVGQLVFGYLVADAACADGTRHWGLDIKVWDGLLSLGALLLAGAAIGTGFLLWRATAREPRVDPRGRVGFLGFWGVVGGLFFVALIVLTAIGILYLEQCRQG